MTKIIAYDPDDRVSARQALRYAYFRELRQAEKKAAAQAQALAIASSQHSTPSATPRATPAAAPSPAPSTTVNPDGKAVRSARAEERETGAGAKASGGAAATTVPRHQSQLLLLLPQQCSGVPTPARKKMRKAWYGYLKFAEYAQESSAKPGQGEERGVHVCVESARALVCSCAGGSAGLRIDNVHLCALFSHAECV